MSDRLTGIAQGTLPPNQRSWLCKPLPWFGPALQLLSAQIERTPKELCGHKGEVFCGSNAFGANRVVSVEYKRFVAIVYSQPIDLAKALRGWGNRRPHPHPAILRERLFDKPGHEKGQQRRNRKTCDRDSPLCPCLKIGDRSEDQTMHASVDSLDTVLRRVRLWENVNVPRLSAYSIRHRVASVLRASKQPHVPGEQISYQLGHKRLSDRGEARATRNYGDFGPDYLAEASAALAAWLVKVMEIADRFSHANSHADGTAGRKSA